RDRAKQHPFKVGPAACSHHDEVDVLILDDAKQLGLRVAALHDSFVRQALTAIRRNQLQQVYLCPVEALRIKRSDVGKNEARVELEREREAIIHGLPRRTGEIDGHQYLINANHDLASF